MLNPIYHELSARCRDFIEHDIHLYLPRALNEHHWARGTRLWIRLVFLIFHRVSRRIIAFFRDPRKETGQTWSCVKQWHFLQNL